jgi:hypothetical protein
MIKPTDTMNLFEIYHYINKLERRIIRLEHKLKSKQYSQYSNAKNKHPKPKHNKHKRTN